MRGRGLGQVFYKKTMYQITYGDLSSLENGAYYFIFLIVVFIIYHIIKAIKKK